MNNIYDIYHDISLFESKLTTKKVDLAQALKSNNELGKLKADLEKVNEISNELNTFIKSLSIFDKAVNMENANYKQRRLDFLSQYIDKNLEVAFPYEGFKSKIICDFKNKSQKTYLELTDKLGRESSPRVSEGKFCQELVSFSSSIAITECMGMNKFYMDEAFAASSPHNLTKVGELLSKLIDKDFQILLIEQKDDIYKDLPRREIHLFKDEISGALKVTKTVDY